MEQVQRGAMGFFIPVAIAIGVASVMGGWVAVPVFAAESAMLLAVAWLAARAEARDPVWKMRRCLECGRPAPAAAAICPDEDCDGTLFGTQAQLIRRSQLIEQAARANMDTERQAAALDSKVARRWSWLPQSGRRVVGWWGSVTFAAVLDPDPRDPASMRWWASALLVAGAVVSYYSTAAWLDTGYYTWRYPFLSALPVPIVMLAAAYAASRWGPRSMVERAEAIELPGPSAAPRAPQEATVRLSVYVREIVVHDSSDPLGQKGEFDVAVTAAACPAAAVRHRQTIASVRWTGSVASGHVYPVERWLEPVDVREDGSWLSVTAGGVERDLIFDDTIYGGVTVLGPELDWGRGRWWRTVNGKHFDLVFCVTSGKGAHLPPLTDTFDAPGTRSSSMARRALSVPGE